MKLLRAAALMALVPLSAGCSTSGRYRAAASGTHEGHHPSWRNAEYFATQVEAKVRQIAARVREDVARGRLDATALPDLARRRELLDAALQRVSTDGEITEDERHEVADAVQGLAMLYQHHWIVPRAVGGGPAVFPPYVPPEEPWLY